MQAYLTSEYKLKNTKKRKNMYEQAASNWIVGLYSFLDPTNILSFVPYMWNRQAIGSRYSSDTKVRDVDVLMGYFILFWATIYLLFDKCLNLLFRRMRFPLVQRSRIIKAAWNCGFGFGSVCYMISSSTQFLSFAPRERGMTYQEIGVAEHKGFYFHQAGIDILCHGAWTRGCANLLFASFILNPYLQNSRWCTITSIFIMYKTIDIVIVNICQILLCIFQSGGRSICKLLFLLHCLNWTYLYLYYVPVFMLWSKETRDIRMNAGLWLWFAAECLDSVWLKLIRHAKATHWLEICLFPPPTREAIELAGIHKRHKESLKKFNSRMKKKVELWQTLVCAMAIKKKIKKIRQAKSKDSDLSMDLEEETELLQTHKDMRNELVEN